MYFPFGLCMIQLLPVPNSKWKRASLSGLTLCPNRAFIFLNEIFAQGETKAGSLFISCAGLAWPFEAEQLGHHWFIHADAGIDDLNGGELAIIGCTNGNGISLIAKFQRIAD